MVPGSHGGVLTQILLNAPAAGVGTPGVPDRLGRPHQGVSDRDLWGSGRTRPGGRRRRIGKYGVPDGGDSVGTAELIFYSVALFRSISVEFLGSFGI